MNYRPNQTNTDGFGKPILQEQIMTSAYPHLLIHLTIYLKRFLETKVRFCFRSLDSDLASMQ